MTENAICVWDFTCGQQFINLSDLKELLNKNCKKWCFQLEKGENTDYIHWQGRLSLKTKVRKNKLITLFNNIQFSWTPTSNENSKNDFYACKEDTRIDGPYKDTDPVIYIPRQIREIQELYPWQQSIVDMSQIWDTRTINILLDEKGNIGKSILVGYMRAHKLAFKLPFCNDFKDIMRMVCDVPVQRCYLIDMPKGLKKEKLFNMFSALEEIKNGYAYDDRYHFKDVVFDCPNIWVFMNKLPDFKYLSADRWKIWRIFNNQLMLDCSHNNYEDF